MNWRTHSQFIHHPPPTQLHTHAHALVRDWAGKYFPYEAQACGFTWLDSECMVGWEGQKTQIVSTGIGAVERFKERNPFEVVPQTWRQDRQEHSRRSYTVEIEKLKTLKVLSPLVWCKWKSKIELQNFNSYLPYFVILFCNSLHQALLFHFVEAEKSRLQGEKGLVLAHLSCRHRGQTRMLIWWSAVPKNRSQWSLRPQKVLSPHAWGAFRRRQMEEKVRPVFTIGLWLIEGFPGQKWVLHIFE